MSYRWHSQRQDSFDAIRLTWIAIDIRKREVAKKKKNTKTKSIKKGNYRFNFITIREKKNNLHWSHSQHKLHSHSPMKL